MQLETGNARPGLLEGPSQGPRQVVRPRLDAFDDCDPDSPTVALDLAHDWPWSRLVLGIPGLAPVRVHRRSQHRVLPARARPEPNDAPEHGGTSRVRGIR